MNRLVNVSFAAAMIFLSACSDNREDGALEPVDNSSETIEIERSQSVDLPAVWNTTSLTAAITDLGLSGGPDPRLAVTMEGGLFQLFDLNGAVLTAPTELGATAIASGETVVLGDVLLTLFPGLDESGGIFVYAHNAVLDAPVALPLLPTANAAGLCAGPPLQPDDLMQIAYWTPIAPERLIHLAVVEENGELSVIPATEPSDGEANPIAACILGLDITTARSSDVRTLARIGEPGVEYDIVLYKDGHLTARAADGELQAIILNDGISVRAPSAPSSLAALTDVRFGGYPNGVIILGGELETGDHRITFVEPGPLFVE